MSEPMPSARRAGGLTLTDQVYERLRTDLLGGELQPGEKLRVEHLRQRYDVGASPIREALARLTGDGLVDQEGRRGFTVSRVSRAELEDITEMRILLEVEALKRAMLAGDDAWEADILASFHRLSRLDSRLLLTSPGDEWEQRHGEFHAALVAASGSGWLSRFRSTLFELSERYRRIALALNDQERSVPDEHRALMTATLNRDAESAAALMAQHIRRTADAVARSPLIEAG